jgi:hypothetical protein
MASTQLTRTVSSAGNRQAWTLSMWVKRGALGVSQKMFGKYTSSTDRLAIEFNNSDQCAIFWGNSGGNKEVITTRLFRDTSAFYHILFAADTTSGTASDRLQIWVNGVKETTWSTETQPAQNANLPMNDTGLHEIGSYTGGNNFDGILSHIHFSDGNAYTPSVFGETDSTTGEWKIKTDPSFTLGTNGFTILKDGNTITDQSSNSNNWSLGAGTVTNTEDSPSNVFATWNPLQATTAATYDFVKGNTRVAANDVAQFSLGATLAAATGKYYMEMIWVQHGGYDRWGMMPINASVSSTPHITGIAWDESAANLYMLGNVVSGSWGANMSTSDIIQIALDLDNGAFYLGVNGTWRNSGDPTSGASRTGAANFSATSLFGEDLTFAVGKGNAGTSGWNANFGNGYFETTAVSSAGTNASGNGIFEYDVPTGYTALSTKGLNL